VRNQPAPPDHRPEANAYVHRLEAHGSEQAAVGIDDQEVIKI